MMKKRQFTLLMVLVLLFCSLTLSSCGQNSGDEELMDELAEPEITVKYLSGEYADQILKDGGEKVLGTISIDEAGNGDYDLTVNSMVIVESSITDEGYYVADKNLSETDPLDSEARVTYIRDKKKGPQVMDLDKFIARVQKDTASRESSSDSDSEEEKLYDVYIIGGSALMILARELPDA